MMKKIRGLFLSFLLLLISISAFSQHKTMISGKVLSTEKTTVDFATVYLKGTNYGGTTNEEGIYHLQAPAGEYTLVVSAIGYKTVEKPVKLMRGERTKMNVVISPQATELDEVVVVSNGVTRLKRSAFNAVALDTKALQNSTQNLSEALAQAPGMKIRESGGVGSDMQLMMDGFTGKHIKIFIDGVPQEGVGSSFGLNNIPVNYAERIEVYKGVVPVGFGTDAIGGVINIITKKNRNKWFLDASYSYGSFNTHKSYVNFGQTFRSVHYWIVRKDAPYCQVRILWWICLPQSTSTPFNQLFRQLATLSRLRLHVTLKGSTGILTGSAIGLAVRLSLRTRLTLIRLALIRKP